MRSGARTNLLQREARKEEYRYRGAIRWIAHHCAPSMESYQMPPDKTSIEFVITFRTDARPDHLGRSSSDRLRGLLKIAGRAFGLRCKRISTAPADKEKLCQSHN